MGCHFLLQGIVPTQGSNPYLLHCRWILYHLSHQGSLAGLVFLVLTVILLDNRFSVYKVMSSINTGSFTSSDIDAFCFLFLLIALSRKNTRTMLNRSAKNRHSFLFMISEPKIQLFTSMCAISCGFFHWWSLSDWGNFFYFLFAEYFYHERVLDFGKCYICDCWDHYLVCITYPVNMLFDYWLINNWRWFLCIKSILQSWGKISADLVVWILV